MRRGVKKQYRNNPLVRAWSVCIVIASGVGGCGALPEGALVLRSAHRTSCSDAEIDASDLVLLAWGDATTPLYPDDPFDALDLTTFRLTDGGTLADHVDVFRNRVLFEVQAIYCAFSDASIAVRHAVTGDDASRATMVYIVQATQPEGGAQVGEAQWDPCNRYDDDAAVIFGEQMRRLAGGFDLDEWVNIFANTIAHEIGHTLGYGHIDRSEAPRDARPLYSELMLDIHTIDELVRPQRFVVDQSNCPGGSAHRKAIDEPTVSCPGPP